MTLEQFEAEVNALRADALAAFEKAANADELEAARIQFLGDRSGRIKNVQQPLGGLAKEYKPAAGRAFNEIKQALTGAHEERLRAVSRARQEAALEDPTMPARRQWRGAKHPVTLVIDEVAEIFRELGFTIALGPQV